MDSEASIVLLTLDGARTLPQLLAALATQTVKPREVLAIDSGSSDGTVPLLEGAGVSVTAISRHDFGHAKTRNMAVRQASGRFVVFLTQDAVPATPRWLEHLLRSLQTFRDVAGCYSRHLPRPGSDLLEAVDLRVAFRSVRQVRTLPSDRGEYHAHIFEHIRFSNSSSSYPRALLLEHPFDESLSMGEDQEWAKRMLERGLAIVYEPESSVLHSHDHSLAQKFSRHYQMGAAFARFLSPIVGRWPFPIWIWLLNVMNDAVALAVDKSPLRARLRWLLRSPLDRAVTHYAYYRGWRSSSPGA
jgi:rhamnosyltransferase